MDSMAIILGLLLTGLAAAAITRPWWDRRNRQWPTAEDARQSLTHQYEATLTALRSLDFDYAVDKVTPEDYQTARQALLQQAAALVEQLDASPELDALIESQVAAARNKLSAESAVVCPDCGRTGRPTDRFCAGCGARLHAACPTCGEHILPTDRYCIKCGAALTPSPQPETIA